jgi:hypothetical protein
MATPTVYTPKRLINPTQLAGSNATLYTSPNGQNGTQLTSVKLVNTDSTHPRRVTVYVVEDGGSAADNRALLHEYVLPSGGFPHEAVVDGPVYMNADDTLQGFSDAANLVTVHLSGVELD